MFFTFSNIVCKKKFVGFHNWLCLLLVMFLYTVRYVKSAEYEGAASAILHDVTVKWCVELMKCRPVVLQIVMSHLYSCSQEQEYVRGHWHASKGAR
jgi:hypothetical protein